MPSIQEIIKTGLRNTAGMPDDVRAAIIATCVELQIGVDSAVEVMEHAQGQTKVPSVIDSRPKSAPARPLIVTPSVVETASAEYPEEGPGSEYALDLEDDIPPPIGAIGAIGFPDEGYSTTTSLRTLADSLPAAIRVQPAGFDKPLVINKTIKTLPAVACSDEERLVRIAYRAGEQNDAESGPFYLLDPRKPVPSQKEILREIENQANMLFTSKRRTIEAVAPRPIRLELGALDADPSMIGSDREGEGIQRVGDKLKGDYNFTPIAS